MLKKKNDLDPRFLEKQFVELVSKSTDYYRNKILKKNKKFDFDKPVVLFGAAKMGVIYLDLCKKNKLKVLAFCDNDKSKQNSSLKNIKIVSAEVLKSKFSADTQIIITSLYDDEIKKQLSKLGFKNIWSHTFFSTIFAKQFSVLSWTNYINFINSKRKDLIEFFKILDDVESKNVFLNIIKYRLSLNRKYLKLIKGNIENIYFDKSVYDLSECEILVDGGAFDGDTIDPFIRKTKNKFNKIYCFEPDNKSYCDLKKFVDKQNDKRVKVFKYGLGSKEEIVFFTNDGGLGSKVSDNGEKIKIVSLDNFIKDKITLIKLDIEGCEKDALLGAEKIILKYKPKLAICVYHNLVDLWEIPLLIKKINPEYKIYLRHYNEFLFDTVCYFI